MNFQTWYEEKKVKDSDFVFKKPLKTQQQNQIFSQICEQMASLRPSFSEGLTLLELSVELILMGHSESLFEHCADFKNWYKHLKQLRFPITSLRDDELERKFEKLPWPQGAKIKFERRGDKVGVELKSFICSSSDIAKIMAALERVQKELNS